MFTLQRKTLFVSLFVVSGFATDLAHAHSSVEPMVVTATRSNERLDAITRDVSVFTSADIAQSSAQSVADFLAISSGMQTLAYGNAGATSGLFLRGSNSNHVLVLVDGQRIGSSTAGLTALETLSLSSIDRIEIVRGPHSAFYGADALGGVVHIFTKRNAPTSIYAQAGTARSVAVNAQTGFGSGPVTGAITVSHAQSDSFNAITNPNNFSYNADLDGYRRTGATLALRYAFANDRNVRLRLFHNDLNTQFDGSADFDDRSLTKVSGAHASVELGNTQIALGLSQDNARYVSAFPSTFRTRTAEASLQHSVVISAGVRATAIVDARNERIDSSEAFERDARRTIGVVGRMTGDVRTANWTLAARVDNSNQFGTQWTGSAGIRLPLTSTVTLFANAGNAFKAPTFNDLYYPGYSNPNLRAERSVGGDFGLRASMAGTQASATLHSARVKDLIVFQCDADFNCAPQNVNEARIDGVSLTLSQQLGAATTLHLTLDAQDPRDARTDAVLPRRAKTYGSVRLSHRLGPAQLFASVSASAKRFDDAKNKVPLAGYARVDLGADYALTPQITMEARLKNVTDRTITLAGDFASPGREVFVGVRWSEK